jgi:hypothetical protein
MYARVRKTAALPFEHGQEPAPTLLGKFGEQPGFAGAVFQRSINGPGGCLVTLWESKPDAEASWDRLEQALGQSLPLQVTHDAIYEVRHVASGASADQEPLFSSVLWFDGPRSEAQAAADDLARVRISPVTSALDGLVSTWVLRGEDLSQIIVSVTTSLETIEGAVDAIGRTELLAGEDPSLVPMPSSRDIYRVRAYAPARVTVSAS